MNKIEETRIKLLNSKNPDKVIKNFLKNVSVVDVYLLFQSISYKYKKKLIKSFLNLKNISFDCLRNLLEEGNLGSCEDFVWKKMWELAKSKGDYNYLLENSPVIPKKQFLNFINNKELCWLEDLIYILKYYPEYYQRKAFDIVIKRYSFKRWGLMLNQIFGFRLPWELKKKLFDKFLKENIDSFKSTIKFCDNKLKESLKKITLKMASYLGEKELKQCKKELENL